MWLIMLEAGIALFLLVFIVWWTMFSGNQQNPPRNEGTESTQDKSDLPQ